MNNNFSSNSPVRLETWLFSCIFVVVVVIKFSYIMLLAFEKRLSFWAKKHPAKRERFCQQIIMVGFLDLEKIT